MADDFQQYKDMSLDEFIKQTDTTDFVFINDSRFQKYISDKPYIKIGTELGRLNYVVAYTKQRFMDKIFTDLGSNFVTIYPQLLAAQDAISNRAAGISQVHHQPYLNLTGQGVLIGLVDTGIDYTQKSFIYENGTSKIKYIWDQTIDGNPPPNIRFGSVYTQEMINEALKSPYPTTVVPSKDTEGHGTFLASVAAGREDRSYTGAAPDSEIIAVKLKPANVHHLQRFNIEPTNQLYSSIDFILGIKFILDRAEEANMPVVICIGMASNFGGHDGNTPLEKYISSVTSGIGIVCVAAAGNESNKRRHTMGQIAKAGDTDIISFNVGDNVQSFLFFIWNASYDKISTEVISPIGETTSRLPVQYGSIYSKKLVLEHSVVTVRYHQDISNLAIVHIAQPTKGIWNVVLHGDTILNGTYHSWIPISRVINQGVDFLRPFPDYTVVVPATASRIICCGAYNAAENSLFISSSWGPTRGQRMAPDFVAPGVNVIGVYPTGYGTMTGTSAAAAIASGASALLLQWGIVQGNEPSMGLDRVRSLLISGCKRQENIQYPNSQWGFGMLNLYNSFEFLKES